MAAQWQININPVELPPAQDVWASLERRVSSDPSPPKVSFDPPQLDVEVGDQIFWTNNDSEAHRPGLKNADGSINDDFFMQYSIAPDSSSDTFSPGVADVTDPQNPKPLVLVYVCSLHLDPPCSEPGTIVVNPA